MFSFGRKTAKAETTPKEVQERIQRGERLLVLDVREPSEYREGRVAGSKLIPLGQLALQLDKLPKDQPIVAVCRSGNRSGVATDLLRRAGFDAVNMRGGMIEWARQGLPMERSR
jgi:rhodanese-related sulfurtransferase